MITLPSPECDDEHGVSCPLLWLLLHPIRCFPVVPYRSQIYMESGDDLGNDDTAGDQEEWPV